MRNVPSEAVVLRVRRGNRIGYTGRADDSASPDVASMLRCLFLSSQVVVTVECNGGSGTGTSSSRHVLGTPRSEVPVVASSFRPDRSARRTRRDATVLWARDGGRMSMRYGWLVDIGAWRTRIGVCAVTLGVAGCATSREIPLTPTPSPSQMRVSKVDFGTATTAEKPVLQPPSETVSAFAEVESGNEIVPVSHEPNVLTPPQPAPVDEMPSEPAAPPAAPLSLVQLEQLAVTYNPTIRQASASAHKAIGIRDQVGRCPNPVVGYDAVQLADAGTDQHSIFVEQEFVRGDKLALNEAVIDQTVQAQLWEVEAQRRRVITDVRMRFYETLAAQRRLELTTRFRDVIARGAKLAELRREALEGSQADVLQAEIQLNEIELALQQAEFKYQGAWRELMATVGLPQWEPQPLQGELATERWESDWENTYFQLVGSSPELNRARSRAQEARANLSRQEVQAIPNVTLQVAAGRDNGTESGFLNVSAGLPLPLFNKNEGNISAANAEYCRAAHDVQRLELSLKARLARVSQEYESALAAVERYEQQILPKAEQMLTLAEQAYEAGEFAFLQVLVIRQTSFEANVKYVDAQNDLAQARARLDGLLLTGALAEPLDVTTDDGLRSQALDQR